ncbi:MAG: urea ABC transporter substrate-binding protein [Planctomycetales bacterium]|nr:urea ABC transporter substrate-binding protein [Planctomycetales bacterium]
MSRLSCGAMLLCLLALRSPIVGAAEPAPPLRLGVLHSLSGTMASSERPLVEAARMAIDEINLRGGVLGRPLQPVVADGKSDGETFAREAERLIVQEKVVALFGCWTSASRKAVLPVIEEHRQMLWYPLQYEGQESSPYIIYTGAVPNQQIIPAVEWCRREFGSRMFLVGSDYVFPRTVHAIIKEQLAQAGEAPVGEAYQPLGSSDFDEIVARIRDSQPQVVLNTINGDSNHAFFAAFVAAGLDPRQLPIMSFSVAETQLLHIGRELTAGHYCSWNYFQSIDTPANRRFVREFRRRYGADRVTDDPMEAAYVQIHLFAKAVEKCGSTNVDAIRRAVRGLVFAAPSGLVRIDPRNQHTWKVARIGRAQNDGQFRIVWSSEDPLPPQPYRPELFLRPAAEQEKIMIDSISNLSDLESSESSPASSTSLLADIANVRGRLATVNAQFRIAVLERQQHNRLAFEHFWREFTASCHRLSRRREEFTPSQLEAYDHFGKARESFSQNAAAMMTALYPAESVGSEVEP